MNTTPHSGRLHKLGRAGRMRNHRRPSRSGQRGYTLIEVIVAFALLAVGLGILLAILSGGVRQVAWAGQATHAALYADSLMSTLGADARLQEGQRQGEFEHGKYRWTMQVERVQQPLPPAAAGASVDNPTNGPPDIGDVNFRANELYRIALEMRWGDALDQRMHVDTVRAYAPGPDLLR